MPYCGSSCFKKIIDKAVGLILCSLLLSVHCWAQFNVTVRLKSLPVSHKGEPVFIAGNFNNWQPGDDDFKIADTSLILDNVSQGDYQFKFTRGSWDKVECGAAGAEINNRTISINSDTTLVYTIEAWKDDFSILQKAHTASASVKLLDTAFEMPQLQRLRRIWVYLPPGYEKSKDKYPVIYMHDGQNLFDDATAPYGEWHVDECLDSLALSGKAGCIVIGIDNGGETRMSEYNPYLLEWKDSTSSKTFMPEGEAYLAFIVNTLKPYVDRSFRTMASKENTIIAGSSMGGLISCYAVLKYPEVFGKAGIFSPSFWAASGIDSLANTLPRSLNPKMFFYAGEKEGDEMVNDMNRIAEKIGKNTAAMIYCVTDKDGIHNEASWYKWFPDFVKWITADGYNTVLKAP